MPNVREILCNSHREPKRFHRDGACFYVAPSSCALAVKSFGVSASLSTVKKRDNHRYACFHIELYINFK